MAGRYFGTDGIRGRANKFPMTAEVAMKVGMAAGLSFQRGSHRHRVVLGKDTRLSGYMIENALVSGLCAAGMDVFLLGPIPTPAVAMLVRSLRADIGVMISASHNPYSDNGIKLFGPDGYKLSDEIEERIEQMLDNDVEMALADTDGLGRAKRVDGVHDRYIEFAKRTLPRSMSLSGLRIVVDCANGAAYKVAPAALWELGAEVVAINVEPNGFNINKECGSTHPVGLQKKVHEVRADIGIALDGDADRVMLVDERGHVVDGDQLLALIAASWKEDGRLTKPGVVATVMSNLGLERFLGDLGLSLLIATGVTASIDIVTRADRQPAMDNYIEGVWSNFRLDSEGEAAIAATRNMHAVLVDPVAAELHRLGSAGVLTGADVSADFLDFRHYDAERLASTMRHVDTGFIGWPHEADHPTVERIRRVAFDLGRLVVVTLGARGILVFDGAHGSAIDVPVDAVPVKGTTVGCGDAFIAAFLAARWQGSSLEQALASAKKAGAEATRWRRPLPDEAYAGLL